jgi:hypothetical protein
MRALSFCSLPVVDWGAGTWCFSDSDFSRSGAVSGLERGERRNERQCGIVGVVWERYGRGGEARG